MNRCYNCDRPLIHGEGEYDLCDDCRDSRDEQRDEPEHENEDDDEGDEDDDEAMMLQLK